MPVTLLQPLPVVVTEIRRPESHGYSAVQLAWGETLAKRVRKPMRGILTKAGTDKILRHLYESRQDAGDFEGVEVGQELGPESVSGWGEVTVTGTSQGKGFAGAVKRWGFRGQQRTHGDPDNRRPQSANATDPARIFKGSRRPGRMGHERATVKGLSVVGYNDELNLLAIKGSVPGANGGTVWLTMTGAAPEKPVEQEA